MVKNLENNRFYWKEVHETFISFFDDLQSGMENVTYLSGKEYC